MLLARPVRHTPSAKAQQSKQFDVQRTRSAVQVRATYAPRSVMAKRNYAVESDAKLIATFAVPHQTIFKDREVRSITVPGVSGKFGILRNHVPTIAQLKPGVVEVTDKDGTTKERWFVSAGFAFVHKDSTCSVNASEAVPLEQIDPEAARTAFKHYQDLLTKATDPQDKAIAAIGIQTNGEILRALGVSA